MVRLVVTGMLLLLVAGCAEIPASRSAGGAANLKQICETAVQGGSVAEGSLAGALAHMLAAAGPEQAESVLTAAAQDLPYCFRHNRAGGILAATLVGADEGALLWFEEGEWRGAPTSGMLEYPEILWQDPDGKEVWLAGRGTGTGGRGFLLLLRRQGEEWQTLLKSEVYDHFQPRVLDRDHLLVTARNLGDVPLAWDANCCQPTNYQWLWKRQGDSFAVAAERVAPEPYYAANVFFGALRYGRMEWLDQVATPEAIDDVDRLELAVGELHTNTPKSGPEFGAAVRAELNHWPALPPALNGPVPAVEALTVQVEVVENGPVLKVELQRLGGKWLVTSVR